MRSRTRDFSYSFSGLLQVPSELVLSVQIHGIDICSLPDGICKFSPLSPGSRYLNIDEVTPLA
jgi:hypothetical protein